MGEPEVDQHRFAARPKQHVGRLQVEVDDVLPMEIVQARAPSRTQARDFFRRHRRAVEPVVQPDAVDELHDEIRRRFDVAVGDERRVMGALRERAQHRPADLEADDVHGALAGAEPRDLHDERKRAVGPVSR